VLNQNVYADERLYGGRAASSQLLLGPRYALLREQFSTIPQPQRRHPAIARRLLVTLGGADPGNATLTMVRALQQLVAGSFEAVVVVGGGNPHLESLEHAAKESAADIRLVRDAQNMPELMGWADLAISAAGSTTLELAFMGVPMLLVVLADNQAPVAERMAALGAARSLGRAESLTAPEMAQAIGELIRAESERGALSGAAQRLVDGRGANRVAQALKRPVLQLRPVTAEDVRLLFALANDPVTRAASFQPAAIPWEEHERWFQRKLASADSIMFVAENGEKKPAGAVRFDMADQIATISISLAPEFRGLGCGQQVITDSARLLFQRAAARGVRALVKPGNVSSSRAFLGAGFHEEPAASTEEALVYFLPRPEP
jgi:RimJ/RimL family protein N-acetyltransferase